MTLDDFEKSLAKERKTKEREENKDTQSESRKRRKHNHHNHRRRHERDDDREKPRRSKHSNHHVKEKSEPQQSEDAKLFHSDEGDVEWIEKDGQVSDDRGLGSGQLGKDSMKRDSWMEKPSAFDYEFTQKGIQKPPELANTTSSKADFQLKIHNNELNKHHLQNLADGKEYPDDVSSERAQQIEEYVFGDSGAPWRMTKLKAVYRRAQESGVDVEVVAAEQYGDLRALDDAREEETELERRKTYGEGYVGKQKPDGQLFHERKLKMGVPDTSEKFNSADREDQVHDQPDTELPASTVRQVDQTALNRLKARMLKAKLKGSAEATSLEADYNEAVALSTKSTVSNTVVLSAMDNRMLTGGRDGEVNSIATKRGRERGLVEENEDMSIQDMVKQERRTRNQLGGDGQRFAERIAKDAKFDVSLAAEEMCTYILIRGLERSGLHG